MTITEFLTARYDAEEEVARSVDRDAEPKSTSDFFTSLSKPTGTVEVHPDRVLADIAAKRAIVTLYEGSGLRIAMGQVLRHLAQPYAEHPDFDPAWRV